ncbi:UvrD-helicase domain-containing protein [Nocardioides sp.]|uniref:UvrD-helicase domain-containing protein n=1 Tax=Nocardioides sp. TaxID=35761 RepID=UPI0035155DE2
MSTPFSIRDPLPAPGETVLLEASAGTGKTWTIAALVARHVAEGRARLEEMLVITFGRAASQELRERVRGQLVELERALAGDPAVDVAASELLTLLVAEADDAVRAERRARVAQALADFDGATIATTHQFCAIVLDSLGVAGDSDPGARLVDDLDQLRAEVVDDLYLRAFAPSTDPPAFTYAEAREIAKVVVDDPQAALEPGPGPGAPRRVAFAAKVREEMAARKRGLGWLSYDDLLSQLADALADDDAPARERMRERWRVVLVDEFQDTDPVQWQVLERAFAGVAAMVLIGDPKQAIYAFRGGDVHTYLAAAATATTVRTLGVSWRADTALHEAVHRLLAGAELGDPRIVVHPVAAHHGTRLHGAPASAPFRLRVVRRGDLGFGPGRSIPIKRVREHVAADLAHDVRRLLDAAPTYDGRALRPADVAVIAYRHADLADAQQALREVGVPAVIAGGGSVFGTAAAREWLALLEALEQPHRAVRLRAAALTAFLGLDAVALDAGGEELTDRLGEQLRAWSELLARRGVAAVLETALAEGLPARVLAQVGGERRLTDLRHLGELLHEAALGGPGARGQRLGPVALVAWLRTQIRESARVGAPERTRRLDSDAAAVQLVTIHASKGLEYPVVYLPALADRWVDRDRVGLPLFHQDGRRCRDVTGSGPQWDPHVTASMAEDAGEWLRLLYVALTRARSQVVAWWAPSTTAPHSPLHRMLMREAGSPLVPEAPPVPREDEVVGLFAAWRDRGGPAPEAAQRPELGAPTAPDPTPPLAARSFARAIDLDWRRTSYSALSAAAAPHDPAAAAVPDAAAALSEVEDPGLTDEPDAVEPVPGAGAGLGGGAERGPVSPMATLPVGATFGSLVHAVLEHADPDAPAHGGDLRAELAAHLAEQRVWWPVELDDDVLLDALMAVHDTPLGPSWGGRTLRQVPLRDRRREMDFELPLAGGDDARAGSGSARLGDLAPLLRAHLPEGDPVRAYADTLDDPALAAQPLRGYLTGSVDLVARIEDRYLVVDYKTNWLGERDAEPHAADYRPAVLAAAMAHSDYPLQALLYAVVLHRFLRWRLPGYDPAQHLGGVAYLYLRGLCGPETPTLDGGPCGVFTWQPPVPLLEAVSDLLDGAPGEAR